MLFCWASFTISKEKVERGWGWLYEFKIAETSNWNVRMQGQRFLSRLSMLKSRATSRERLFMTSTSDETPEASLAPRSTYFKMTFCACSASGQDQTLKTRRIACLFVWTYVLSWKQPSNYSGRRMKKTFMGKLGSMTRCQGNGGRTKGSLDNCISPFRWTGGVVAGRYAGLHAVGALQTQSVICWLSCWGCLVVQNGVVYHGSSWRWCPPVAEFRIRRPDFGIITCIEPWRNTSRADQ